MTRKGWLLAWAAAGALLCAAPVIGRSATPEGTQLEQVRARIQALESQLATLEEERVGVSEERTRLSAELQLAEARVTELELLLESSKAEVVKLRDQAAMLGAELERRRSALSHHLEMMALLGRPGPLQLLLDASRGGNLDQALGTVSVLTAGQVRLMEEYHELQRTRASRLAALSRTMAAAEEEAVELVARRQQLAGLRDRVTARLDEVERSEERTTNALQDMLEREQALGRLMQLLGTSDRSPAGDDIRRFRGALPWPAGGPVVRSFGRHYLPKYATYTLCNGIRLDAPAGARVTALFSGVVAYAQFFKGYGNMVVVDHGHQVFSLVAGLATIFVRVNQRVSMGLELGMAPPPSEEGNLYLEVRMGDKPQDPQRWLQLREGRS
jgi:septal ring factor EnvC (AmiA/AmiB activator)